MGRLGQRLREGKKKERMKGGLDNRPSPAAGRQLPKQKTTKEAAVAADLRGRQTARDCSAPRPQPVAGQENVRRN